MQEDTARAEIVTQAVAYALLPPPDDQRRIIAAAGVSSAEVARQMGLAPTVVQRWVAGTRRPRGSRLIEYCALLRVLQDVRALTKADLG